MAAESSPKRIERIAKVVNDVGDNELFILTEIKIPLFRIWQSEYVFAGERSCLLRE